MVTGSSTSRKRASHQWLCFWPGLVRLWYFGDFSALLFAIGFSILLNLALLSTFVWPQWLGQPFPIVAWSLLFLVWMGSWFLSTRVLKEFAEQGSAEESQSDALFIAAQTEYLKGNWTEAEALVVRQLRFRPRDVETRLLLATIHAHTGHFDEALKQIEILDKFDASQHWRFELDRLEEKIQAGLEQQDSEGEGEFETVEPEAIESDFVKESNPTERQPTESNNETTKSEPEVTDSVPDNKAA